MKRFINRHSIAFVAIVFIAASLFYGQAKSPRSITDSNTAKSDYLFLEAQRLQALDSLDAFYELLAEACRLNPSDLYMANEIGFFNIAINQSDSAIVEENLSKMLAYIKANPTDEIAISRFVRITSNLGRSEETLFAMRLAYENSSNPSALGTSYAKALAGTNHPDSIKKALSLMDLVEKNTTTNISTTLLKMNMHISLDDTTAVIRTSQDFLSKVPHTVENLTFVGDVYMHLNKLDSALAYYNRAVETDPASGLAYYSRAQYFKHIGDSANYDREVFQALVQPDLDIEPKTEILKNYVAELYTDSTQENRIREMFTTLVDQYPHDENVRNLYGSYLWIVNDMNGAAEQYSYMLDTNPDNKQYWITLAQIYYNIKDYQKSKITCENALRYFPDDYEIYTLIANIAMFTEQYDDSDKYLKKALSVADSTNTIQQSELYGLMADLEYRKKNFELVKTYYDKAIELNPENSMFYNNYAYYLACENTDLEKALNYINKALSLEIEEDNTNTATTLDTYAWVLFKNKDYEKALEAIDAVLELESKKPSAEILHHAGDIYFMNGMPEEALEFWEKALKLAPEDELLQRKVKHKTFFYE